VLKSIIALDVDYLSKLVDDLLFLAILDKRSDPSVRMKPITEMLKQIHEKFLHSQDRINLSIQYEEPNLERIKLNELEFLRLMNNLITNGLKYSKSYFNVSLFYSNHELRIELENDYDELDQDYIRNYGKKKSNRKIDHMNKQSSIGLGSVIVFSIVQKWGGGLTIRTDDEGHVLHMSINFTS
jgi:signal transduction histidine kinase